MSEVIRQQVLERAVSNYVFYTGKEEEVGAQDTPYSPSLHFKPLLLPKVHN